jgi:hypothetical protein
MLNGMRIIDADGHVQEKDARDRGVSLEESRHRDDTVS